MKLLNCSLFHSSLVEWLFEIPGFATNTNKIYSSFHSSQPSNSLGFTQIQFETARAETNMFGPALTFNDTQTILDVGCGLGGRTVYYAKEGAQRVIGVDINEARAKYAKKFAGDAQMLDKVEIVIADAANLPFLAKVFDYVISTDTWEHLHEPELAIHESIRVLKSGGRVAVKAMPYYSPWGAHARRWIPIPWIPSFLPRGVLCRILSLLEKHLQVNMNLAKEVRIDWNRPDDVAHARGLTVSRMKGILTVSGTKTENFKFVPVGFRLGGWLASLGQILNRIPIIQEFLTGLVIVVLQKQ
jgi:ubiquinone/menaquinone biosynthesis C-methylase UbiE